MEVGRIFQVRQISHDTGTRFTYPKGMEGELNLVIDCILKWFICLHSDIHVATT